MPVPGWNMEVLSPALAANNAKLGTIAETFQVLSEHLDRDPTKPIPIPKDTPKTHHHRQNPNPLLPSAPTGELGPLCIRLPLPPGSLQTLWQNDKRYVDGYLSDFPGYFHTGDAAIKDKDGYIHIMARADDVLNVAAHRLSSGAIEAAVSSHNAVAECAVIGPHDELKGQVPWGIVVLKKGFESADKAKIQKEISDIVRAEVGPLAAFKTVVFVNRLPKTRSGKVLRATMKAIADKAAFNAPATIDDPAVLDEIKAAFDQIKH
jgi:propionyl-CoA synthetase